jgi:hypothetical protein
VIRPILEAADLHKQYEGTVAVALDRVKRSSADWSVLRVESRIRLVPPPKCSRLGPDAARLRAVEIIQPA